MCQPSFFNCYTFLGLTSQYFLFAKSLRFLHLSLWLRLLFLIIFSTSFVGFLFPARLFLFCLDLYIIRTAGSSLLQGLICWIFNSIRRGDLQVLFPLRVTLWRFFQIYFRNFGFLLLNDEVFTSATLRFKMLTFSAIVWRCRFLLHLLFLLVLIRLRKLLFRGGKFNEAAWGLWIFTQTRFYFDVTLLDYVQLFEFADHILGQVNLYRPFWTLYYLTSFISFF